MGCPDFFFFWKLKMILNVVYYWLMISPFRTRRLEGFGETASLLFLLLLFESRKVHFYVLNTTQDAVFIFKAEGKSLGIASLLCWG